MDAARLRGRHDRPRRGTKTHHTIHRLNLHSVFDQVPRTQFEKALEGGMGFDGSSIEGFARIDEADIKEADINEGLRATLNNNPRALLMGEDIGPLGGVYRVTDGLIADFGGGTSDFSLVRFVPGKAGLRMDMLGASGIGLAGDRLAGYPPFWRDYFDAARWIGPNAPDAVVLARKPSLAWYWSGRPSAVFPMRYDPEATWQFVREIGATHALLDGLISTEVYFLPALQAHMTEFQAVHSAPGRLVFVLRLQPVP